MAYYRIEIFSLGKKIRTFETDDYQEARRLYTKYDENWELWTQLYVDGKTGNKAWMNRKMQLGNKLPRLFPR